MTECEVILIDPGKAAWALIDAAEEEEGLDHGQMDLRSLSLFLFVASLGVMASLRWLAFEEKQKLRMEEA